tara:strand:- start:39 stop:335 length:297 start_codon:yes stop_codon:yes gene_type:complete
MSIKNKTKYLIIICMIYLFISIPFCKVKDLNLPGYQRVYYPVKIENYNHFSIDKVIENIPKKRYTNIETNYSNKYLVKVQLSSTAVEHTNGTRIYSVN